MNSGFHIFYFGRLIDIIPVVSSGQVTVSKMSAKLFTYCFVVEPRLVEFV